MRTSCGTAPRSSAVSSPARTTRPTPPLPASAPRTSRCTRTRCSARASTVARCISIVEALQLNRLAPVPVVSAAVATPGASSRSTPAPGTPGAPVTPARGGETPPRPTPNPAPIPTSTRPRSSISWDDATSPFASGAPRSPSSRPSSARANAPHHARPRQRLPPHGIRTSRGGVLQRVSAHESARHRSPRGVGGAPRGRRGNSRVSPRGGAHAATGRVPRVVGKRRGDVKTAGGDFAEDDAFGDGDRDERGDERAGPVPGGAPNAAAAASSVLGDADAAANATRWMWHFAEGHASLAGGDGEAAVAHFTTLDRSFEDTHHVVLSLARSETLHERAIEAKRLYARCRDVDPHALDGMDGYAELLYTRFADDDRGYTGGGIMSHAADADAHTGGFGVLSTGFGFPGEMGPSAGLARLARDLRRRIPIVPSRGRRRRCTGRPRATRRALWITPSARFARTIATPARSWSRGTCV